MISFKTQDICLNEDMQNLLCKIDKKISKLAKLKLDSSKYDLVFNTDEVQFFILVRYKRVLISKLKNSSCLSMFKLEDIISIIKQYLNSGKVIKLNISPVEQNSNLNLNSLNPASIAVSYIFYGDQM